MEDIKGLVSGLCSKDNTSAYRCLKQLETISEDSNAVYPYFDVFSEMLDDANSYVRTRAIVLIAANAKWDVDNKVDEIIEEYLKHIMDERPITARQCIKLLPVIANHKPELADCICKALHSANPQMYPSSMQPLVSKDIQNALRAISTCNRRLS